jgi:hypothetical protein
MQYRTDAGCMVMGTTLFNALTFFVVSGTERPEYAVKLTLRPTYLLARN